MAVPYYRNYENSGTTLVDQTYHIEVDPTTGMMMTVPGPSTGSSAVNLSFEIGDPRISYPVFCASCDAKARSWEKNDYLCSECHESRES